MRFFNKKKEAIDDVIFERERIRILRERCVEISMKGRSITISDILSDAEKIYKFINENN